MAVATSSAAVEAAADGSPPAVAVLDAAVVAVAVQAHAALAAAAAGSVWEAVSRTAADPETEQCLVSAVAEVPGAVSAAVAPGAAPGTVAGFGLLLAAAAVAADSGWIR